jgi:hypothetical protein
MKGFIEIHLDKNTRLININMISSVQAEQLEGTNVRSAIHTLNERCIYCDESYNDIKQKIEQAQPFPFDPWNLTTAWDQHWMHPNTDGDGS